MQQRKFNVKKTQLMFELAKQKEHYEKLFSESFGKDPESYSGAINKENWIRQRLNFWQEHLDVYTDKTDLTEFEEANSTILKNIIGALNQGLKDLLE
jgi:hypothetical protein